MIYNFKLFLKGILMGIANIIPGVSGGTLAVVLNIFDELIFSLNNIFKDFKKSMLFLIPLFIGVFVGILAFSSVIKFGLTNYSFATNMFFVGLVIGSAPLIYKKAINKNSKIHYYHLSVISFAFILFVSHFSEPTSISEKINFTTFTYIKLFLGGALAAGAMIIPGISGSFLLILLGIYGVIITVISDFISYLKNISNISLLIECLKVIVPVGLGVVLGIFLVTKIINFALNKFESQTYFVILGLIIGSICIILFSSTTYSSGFNFPGIVCGIILLIIGIIGSTVLGK